MIFQSAFFSIALIISIIDIITGSIIGTIITKWLASKKNWDSSLKVAFLVNLPWILLSLIISILETFYIRVIYMDFPFITVNMHIIVIVNLLIAFVINTILSTLLVHRLYRKELNNSLFFVTRLLIILYILMYIFAIIRSYFLSLAAIS